MKFRGGLTATDQLLVVPQRQVLFLTNDDSTSVPASSAVNYTFTPPVGELYQLTSLFLDAPIPPGVGTHSWDVFLADSLNGLLAGESSDVFNVKFFALEWETATINQQPGDRVSQALAVVNLAFSNAAALVIRYTNNTGIATGALTKIVRFNYIRELTI